MKDNLYGDFSKSISYRCKRFHKDVQSIAIPAGWEMSCENRRSAVSWRASGKIGGSTLHKDHKDVQSIAIPAGWEMSCENRRSAVSWRASGKIAGSTLHSLLQPKMISEKISVLSNQKLIRASSKQLCIPQTCGYLLVANPSSLRCWGPRGYFQCL